MSQTDEFKMNCCLICRYNQSVCILSPERYFQASTLNRFREPRASSSPTRPSLAGKTLFWWAFNCFNILTGFHKNNCRTRSMYSRCFSENYFLSSKYFFLLLKCFTNLNSHETNVRFHLSFSPYHLNSKSSETWR